MSTEAYYHWKFRKTPFESPAPIEFVAVDSGRVVGYYAALPYRYQVSSRSQTIGIVCDVMTHSHARGKGVFTRLGKHALSEFPKNGIDLAIAFPIRAASVGGLKKMGMHELFSLPLFIAPLSLHSLLRQKKLGFLEFAATPLLRLLRHLRIPKPDPNTFESIRLSRDVFFSRIDGDAGFKKQFDDFISKWSTGYQNFLVKDVEFFRWRLNAPGTDYSFHIIEAEGQWRGLAITRCTELKGIPACAILDLMILNPDLAASGSLLNAVSIHAKSQAMELIAFMAPDHLAKSYGLGKAGFLKSRFAFKLVACLFKGSLANLSSPRQWHLTWIDSDDL